MATSQELHDSWEQAEVIYRLELNEYLHMPWRGQHVITAGGDLLTMDKLAHLTRLGQERDTARQAFSDSIS
jgi:hypothetical protein